MIGVEEARTLILENTAPSRPQRVGLDAALGRILAEVIVSDIDSPPHDKSLVDGYAVRASDLETMPVELELLEEVTAGKVPTRPVISGSTTRIMTGAPVPDGADAVVMVEYSSPSTAGETRIRLEANSIRAGQNIMNRGTSLRQGETVLRAGHLLRPIEIGLLAEVGAKDVLVHPAASVAILSTGDELVPHQTRPGAGQIRNSNGEMLAALIRRAGGNAANLGIARDQHDELADLIRQGLRHDILVLSGGVSAGVLDLVPGVLVELGVEQVFHKVRLKPGRPLWFGVATADERKPLVFGLPGNPVSGLVCFELFVQPALDRFAGRNPDEGHEALALLDSDYTQRGDRPTYYPARHRSKGGQLRVELLDWKGSADMRTLVDATCLAQFPAGDRRYLRDEEIKILLL